LAISSDIKVGIIITATISFYYLYYYFFCGLLPSKIFRKYDSVAYQIKIYLFRKFGGFIILGLGPLIVYLCVFSGNIMADFGISIEKIVKNFVLILILCSGVFILVYFLSKFLIPLNDTPGMKIENWNLRFFLIDSIGWIFYLIGYEFLFRGILLFTCLNFFGIWPAIAINLAIYSAIHMVKGIGETIGAFVWGLFVCLLTIHFQTILIALILHIVLALSTDYFAVKNKSTTRINLK
jgi:hypothetical protein